MSKLQRLGNYLKPKSLYLLGHSFNELAGWRNELIYFPPMPSAQIFAQKSKLCGIKGRVKSEASNLSNALRPQKPKPKPKSTGQAMNVSCKFNVAAANQPSSQSASIFEEYFPINKVCHNNSLAARNLQHVTSNVLGVIPPIPPPPLFPPIRRLLSIYIFAAIYGADEAKHAGREMWE